MDEEAESSISIPSKAHLSRHRGLKQSFRFPGDHSINKSLRLCLIKLRVWNHTHTYIPFVRSMYQVMKPYHIMKQYYIEPMSTKPSVWSYICISFEEICGISFRGRGRRVLRWKHCPFFIKISNAIHSLWGETWVVSGGPQVFSSQCT